MAITHAGPAHADELIALAILVAKHGLDRIERRNPTQEELADPKTWVLDVGGVHDPDLRNFDHHGVEGTEGRCAFDLLLDHFQMRDVAMAASPWLNFKSSLDCTGPYATAKEFGMTPEALFATVSPVELQVLQAFQKASVIQSGDFLYRLLEMVGNGLISYWAAFAEQLGKAEQAKIFEVKGFKFCDYRNCGKLLPAVMSLHMSDIGACGSVVVDDRDEGCEDRVVLYRHADNPRVDFRRLDATKMHFVHHGGFLAKTATGDNSDEVIRELLAIAVE